VGEHFHYFAGRINKDKRVVFPGKKAKLRKQAGLTIHAVKRTVVIRNSKGGSGAQEMSNVISVV
jgi:hypothetical protein